MSTLSAQTASGPRFHPAPHSDRRYCSALTFPKGTASPDKATTRAAPPASRTLPQPDNVSRQRSVSPAAQNPRFHVSVPRSGAFRRLQQCGWSVPLPHKAASAPGCWFPGQNVCGRRSGCFFFVSSCVLLFSAAPCVSMRLALLNRHDCQPSAAPAPASTASARIRPPSVAKL